VDDMKGIYCLIIDFKEKSSIIIGKKGEMEFNKGCYVYVGSALNSLEARIRRHLSHEKKLHWHVDYLLQSEKGCIVDVCFAITTENLECALSKNITEFAEGVKDFGSSDCKCPSHLFFFEDINDARRSCQLAFHDMGLEVKNLSELNKI
jgi:Uri superfamily endonuclease